MITKSWTSLKSFVSVCLIFLPLAVMAQKQLISTSRATIIASVDVTTSLFMLQDEPEVQGALIQSASSKLEYDDISILLDLSKGKEDDEYEIYFQAKLDGKTLSIHQQDVLGVHQMRIPASQSQTQEIIWSNLLEHYYDFKGQLEIAVSVRLWGEPTLPYGVTCDNPPVFDSRQKLPYYIAAGAGVTAIGLGFIIKAEAQKIYEEQYLTENFEQSAEPHYQDANQKRHTALLLRYGGIGILVANSALYLYRRNRHRKKLSTYNEFCNNQISLTPVFEQTSAVLTGNQLGIKFSYQF